MGITPTTWGAGTWPTWRAVSRRSSSRPIRGESIIAHERDADRVYVRRRLSISRQAQHEHRLPNIVAWPANPDPAVAPARQRNALARVSPADVPAGRRLASEALRAPLCGPTPVPGPTIVRNVARSPLDTARFILSFGYRRFVPKRRAPGFVVRTADNRYPLRYHGEQVPARDSRITLIPERDALGMRRALVDLRFTAQDVDGVVRAHRALGALPRAQRGRAADPRPGRPGGVRAAGSSRPVAIRSGRPGCRVLPRTESWPRI